MTKQQLFDKADFYKNQLAGHHFLVPEEQKEMSFDELKKAAYCTEAISEDLILSLHQLCTKEPPKPDYNRYRTTPAPVSKDGHVPPAPEELAHFMGHFIQQMAYSAKQFHPIEFAAICHKRLLDLFPFDSANEETARLFMNALLIRAGYGVVSIPPSIEKEYQQAIKLAQNPGFPDTDSLVKLIGTCVIKTEEEELEKLQF